MALVPIGTGGTATPECDHYNEWCSLVEGVCIKVTPCVNCQAGEPPERCQGRFNNLEAALAVTFPENCDDC